MKALIAGYSGLTGSSLMKELAEQSPFVNHILIGRSAPEYLPGLTATFIKTDFEALDDLRFDHVKAGFCLLGTTIKKAGSQEKFIQVDKDYVVDFAKCCKANGAVQFHLMSSVGADPNSGNFYLRVKGEVEDEVRKLGFPTLFIYRPSMLLGTRKEFRLGERLGKGVMKALSFAFVGPLSKYRGIETADIAKKMISLSEQTVPGENILYYKDIMS